MVAVEAAALVAAATLARQVVSAWAMMTAPTSMTARERWFMLGMGFVMAPITMWAVISMAVTVANRLVKMEQPRAAGMLIR